MGKSAEVYVNLVFRSWLKIQLHDTSKVKWSVWASKWYEKLEKTSLE
jgi:hypothetical protein